MTKTHGQWQCHRVYRWVYHRVYHWVYHWVYHQYFGYRRTPVKL